MKYYIILFLKNTIISEYHDVSKIRFNENDDLLFEYNGKTHLYTPDYFDSLIVRNEENINNRR